MRLLRPPKRSVSPFGAPVAEKNPWDYLTDAYAFVFPTPPSEAPTELKTWEDAAFVPSLIEELSDLPAGDTADLEVLCSFLLQNWALLQDANLADPTLQAMKQLFNRKTEIFLVDHHNKTICEKLGWAEDHRDVVLFSKERDVLITRFFAPVAERRVQEFSKFFQDWLESGNPDRLLHLLDFCGGSHAPSFEQHVIFAHPALNKIMGNKALLWSLFEKTKSVRDKLSSPTWQSDIQQNLHI